jgi:putative glycosyltransferase (TIGR04348 family)
VSKPVVIIVTPALPDANNGNGQTSLRYKKHLESDYQVILCTQWSIPGPGELQPVAMIALHARKSAASIQAWAAYKNSKGNVPGLVVVLSGTDLYCDLPDHPLALKSLELACQLVVLQELAIRSVPAAYRTKVRVIHQCLELEAPCKRSRSDDDFKVIMVGHIREVKDPLTYMRAARHLSHDTGIQWLHIGRCSDAAYLHAIRETEMINSNYRWIDGVDHIQVLEYIADSDLLVHSSVAEGSPHVIIEAMYIGTPVLASLIEGHVGTLGQNYQGYFPAGDSEALALKVVSLREQAKANKNDGLLASLSKQVIDRSRFFSVSVECEKIHSLIKDLLN